MEEKQNFPRATGFSGKILIASLFILSGILLFARNMGWITSEVCLPVFPSAADYFSNEILKKSAIIN